MLMHRSTALSALLLSAATLVAAWPAAVSANEPARPATPIVVAGTPVTETAAATSANEALFEPDAAGPSRAVAAPRLQSPLTAAPAKPASSQWLVVLIQTALAEKGCNRLAINGEWDAPTRLSVASVLGADQSVTDFEPTGATLNALRTASVGRCGLPDSSEARTAVPVLTPSKKLTAREKKSRASVAAIETAPKAKAAAARTQAKVRQAAPSAPVAARAPVVARAPATFARPIGVGAF